MNKNYVTERLHKINYMMENFVEEDLNFFQKILIVFDLGFNMLRYRAGITEYFQYHFYKKKHIDKKKYIVYKDRVHIDRICNDPKARLIFDNKAQFNTKFNDYIGRDWLEVSKSSFEEFNEFLLKYKSVIIKPIDASLGMGIHSINIDEVNNMQETYHKLKHENVLAEEIIKQNDEIAEFNPSSVNTLRVVTLIDDEGTVHIMTGNLRIGRGNRIADNFHHRGIASLVDVDTGIVKSTGIDGNDDRYVLHPVTGKQIVGFKVPYWKKVKETVIEAARVISDVKYVGWDVAIGKEGDICLIEGNPSANPDINQIPDQVGKKPLYKPFVKGLR